MIPMKTVRVLGQPSWPLVSDRVEALLSRQGGHLAPVTFRLRGKKTVQPYAIAPWALETIDAAEPPLARVMRGDFFCMPFGANKLPYRGRRDLPHGETANARWHFESLTADRALRQSTLHCSLALTVRPGRVDKRLSVRAGQTAMYCEHVLSGMNGPMSMGHHATLRCPGREGAGRLSFSAFRRGYTFPEPLERPEKRGYSTLRPDATFTDLTRVPTITGEWADISRYPARRGFEDIVLLATDPAAAPFAWTAIAFPEDGYVWFALKDVATLPSTLLWMSNGGRHYPPWNGRHVDTLGLEEVSSYFAHGLAESVRPSALTNDHVPTHHRLNPRQPLTIRYIMAVEAIPRDFERVADIESIPGRAGVTLVSDTGHRVLAAVDSGFLNVSLATPS